MHMLCLDLGMKLTGYTFGDGSGTPEVGAWRFDDVGEDSGVLGGLLWRGIRAIHSRQAIDRILYEAPLLDRYRDRVAFLRKIFGMGFLVETWCDLHGVPCNEEPPGQLKKELAGFGRADKSDMVAAAERAGIVLPKTKAAGREDAADSFGLFLIGVRTYARQHQGYWDQRLWGGRTLV